MALFLLSAAFVIGGAAGLVMASQIAGSAQETLTNCVGSYLEVAGENAVPSPELWTTALEFLRWPGFAVFLGFAAFGVIGIPVLFAVRGFLLAFAIGAFVRIFGGVGCFLAFFSFGLTGMFAIPALFVLGVQSFDMARRRMTGGTGKQAPIPSRQYLARSGLCFGALVLCVMVEYWAVPELLSSLAPLF